MLLDSLRERAAKKAAGRCSGGGSGEAEAGRKQTGVWDGKWILFFAGFTPALRQGSAFQGAVSTRPTSRSVSSLKMADAWVRVVPSDSVAAGAQADRLVAGAGAFLCPPALACSA